MSLVTTQAELPFRCLKTWAPERHNGALRRRCGGTAPLHVCASRYSTYAPPHSTCVKSANTSSKDHRLPRITSGQGQSRGQGQMLGRKQVVHYSCVRRLYS